MFDRKRGSTIYEDDEYLVVEFLLDRDAFTIFKKGTNDLPDRDVALAAIGERLLERLQEANLRNLW